MLKLARKQGLLERSLDLEHASYFVSRIALTRDRRAAVPRVPQEAVHRDGAQRGEPDRGLRPARRPHRDHGRPDRDLTVPADLTTDPARALERRRRARRRGVRRPADRPTIVFVHGYPDTKEMWNAVLDRLPERFHAIAYDVRGAGESSRPRGNAAYDFERLGDDLLAVADACRSGPSRCTSSDTTGAGSRGGSSRRSRGSPAGSCRSRRSRRRRSTRSRSPGDELLRGGHVLRWLGRLRRSWYILVLLTPGGADAVLAASCGLRTRWRWVLRNLERVPVRDGDPAPTFSRTTGFTARSCTGATCRGAR